MKHIVTGKALLVPEEMLNFGALNLAKSRPQLDFVSNMENFRSMSLHIYGPNYNNEKSRIYLSDTNSIKTQVI